MIYNKMRLGMLAIVLLLSNHHIAFAQHDTEVVDTTPYILTQTIHHDLVPRDDAIAFIRQSFMETHEVADNESNTDLDNHNDYKSQMATLKNQVSELKQRYEEYATQLSNSESDLNSIKAQLNTLIEQLFTDYSNQDASFINLSEEEQTQRIVSNESVIQLTQQIEDQTHHYNALVAQQQQIKTQYDTVTRQIDQLTQLINQGQVRLNEVLSYAYSMPLYAIDEKTFEIDADEVYTVLTNVSLVLDELVPPIYTQVTFQNIFDAFNVAQHTTPQTTIKQPIVLDESANSAYSYAKPLTLMDIQTYASWALADYHTTQNLNALVNAYHTILQIKENQLHYFYEINRDSFTTLKTTLAKVLNEHQWTDASTVEMMTKFHQLYQLLLVTFNDQTQIWEASAQSSGFFEQYVAYDILMNQVELSHHEENGAAHYLNNNPSIDSNSPSLTTNESPSSLQSLPPIEEQSTQESVTKNPKDNDALKQEKLKKLKEKLNQELTQLPTKRHDTLDDQPKHESSTQSPQNAHLIPHQKNQPYTKGKQTTSSTKNKDLASQLPTTGEKRVAFIVVFILILVGSVLLSFSIKERMKRHKALKQIKLD